MSEKKKPADIVLCVDATIARLGQFLECSHCGDLFKVNNKNWTSDMDRAIEHCKKYHPKAKGKAA